MLFNMQKSHIELEQELHQTRHELITIQTLLKKSLEQILLMQKEIEDLKEKVNKNSNNSSKPPSTDQKSNTPDKKRQTSNGKNRPLFPRDQVDHTVECGAKICPCCSSVDIKELDINEILQQVELPEIKAIITEYILKKYQCCSCKNNFKADLPKGIPNSVFGTKLMGLVSILTGAYHLAKRETIQLIKDLYGIDIGLGSIPNIEQRVTKALDTVCQRIHNFILKSDFTKHFDEPTWRDSGKRNYVWIATCSETAIYMIDRFRNKIAFQKLIKNEDLSAKSCVSDRYAVYNNVSQTHQFCLAHLIRDFRNYSQRDGPDKCIGEYLEKALSKACFIHKKYRDGKITFANGNRQLGKVRKKVQYWLDDGYANASDDLHGLCGRLLDTIDNLWIFTKKQGIEPTNNLAERDLRKIVIWRKKSYGTRSERGKSFVEKITSVVQTLRKQKKNVLNFIGSAVRAFYSNEEPALINPKMGF